VSQNVLPGAGPTQLQNIKDLSSHLPSATKDHHVVQLIHWEDAGSEAFEPLLVMAKEDSITCTKCRKDDVLLDKLGWKQFKRMASCSVKFVA
jgi:hypothetical protein